MSIRVEIAGAEHARAEAESLHAWLGRDGQFRGRVAFDGAGPVSGELGAVQEIVTVAVGGGAVTALSSVIVVWLQTRRSELSVKITQQDGSSFEVTAKGRVADTAAKRLGYDRDQEN